MTERRNTLLGRGPRRIAAGMAVLALAVVAVVAGAGRAVASPEVSAVRLGEHPDTTRFVMELSEATPYRVFTLSNPYRVVVDLPQVDWKIPESRMGETDAGLVEALRFGLFSPNTSRVVLDAAAPVRVEKVFRLPPSDRYPHRLVIDLKRVSREAFQADKGRQIASEEALPSSEATPAEAPKSSDAALPTIVIDAGHGGVDPGAIGVSGTQEKDLVLKYAEDLRDRLQRSGRYHVVLTRKRDIFLRLRERVDLAQKAGGDLFVSLHANTNNSHSIRGASVYTLSETSSDAEAAALAAKENKADLIAGVDLNGQTPVVSQILIDLAQRETMNSSKHFANLLVDDLGHSVNLLKNTHRFAGFAVLKSPNVPSVLVEIGYMTNREEERQLKSAAHRAKVNAAIVSSIDSFFEWQEARSRY